MLRSLKLLTLALAILSGCSKSGDKASPQGTRDPEFPTGNRSNFNTVKILEKRYFWGDCDDKWHPLRKEIARAIDSRIPWMQNYFRSHATSGAPVPDENDLLLAEFIFVKAEPLKSDEWTSHSASWAEVEEFYRKAARTNSAIDWYKTMLMFHEVLEKDVKRLYSERNFGIRPNDSRNLLELKENLRACDVSNLTDCLSKDAKTTLQANTNFRTMWREIVAEKSESERYSKLQFLTEQVQAAWYYTFGFRKNDLVRRAGRNFVLPIKTVSYSRIAPQLKEIIESYWTFEDQKVLIEWTSRSDAFEIMIPDYPVTPVTLFKEKKILINEGETIESFPHEIGHALGLSDDYYPMWNDQTCVYTTAVQFGNIMSGAEGGHALKKHFDLLNRYY